MLQSKGKQFTKDADAFKIHALEGESVLASVQIGIGTFLLTNYRLVSLALMGGIKASFPLSETEAFRSEPSKLGTAFYLTLKGKPEEKIGVMMEDIAPDFDALLISTLRMFESPPELRVESKDAASERYSLVPTNRRKGNVPSHLVKAIQKNTKTGEDPIMIISGQYDSTDGSLIVFSDRCVISKSGIIGGFMAGSLGGSRDATFYFKDITGIEYNSGMLTGVLEILTPSYESSPNKDFWTGILNADKNKSVNDPRASSNTLPLMKDDYLSAKPLIDKLKTMIQESKDLKVVVNTSPVPSTSSADELLKLADLMEKGLVTPDEFQAAKKRLLG